jgi:hypothetical protein
MCDRKKNLRKEVIPFETAVKDMRADAYLNRYTYIQIHVVVRRKNTSY